MARALLWISVFTALVGNMVFLIFNKDVGILPILVALGGLGVLAICESLEGRKR